MRFSKLFLLLASICLIAGKLDKIASLQRSSRNQVISSIASALSSLRFIVPSVSANSQLSPPKLGVRADGSLYPCPKNELFGGCVSSQDDEPTVFEAPWEYDSNFESVIANLKSFVLRSIQYSSLVTESEHYLRFRIDDGNSKWMVNSLE